MQDFERLSISFDIENLQALLSQPIVTQMWERGAVTGIALTQIPDCPDSTKGDNVRGVFWTKPDSYEDEVERSHLIDESQYTQVTDSFKGTYIETVIDCLSEKYRLGRVRLLLLAPRTSLSWHRDPEPRFHLPIVTNPGAHIIIEEQNKHLPADGAVWFTNTTKYHSAFNGGEADRIHLVATYLGEK